MKSICKINSLKNICSYIILLQVQRRQAENEAEEQRKLDVELMEARRQQSVQPFSKNKKVHAITKANIKSAVKEQNNEITSEIEVSDQRMSQ